MKVVIILAKESIREEVAIQVKDKDAANEILNILDRSKDLEWKTATLGEDSSSPILVSMDSFMCAAIKP